MDLTLGDSKLNIKNDSLRNPVEATLGNSLGVPGSDPLGSLKANTLSSRKPDGASDGQFSEYNEVLKSPLLEAPKLNVTKGGPNITLHEE